MSKLKIVDDTLIGNVVKQAQTSPRLRMNYNFHEGLGDKCQRLLNALEPGTVMPIHHHKVDEMWMVLKGKLRLTIHDDSGAVIERNRRGAGSKVLCRIVLHSCGGFSSISFHLQTQDYGATPMIPLREGLRKFVEYVAKQQAAGDTQPMQEIAVEYNDKVIYPDKVRLNCYYYRHYSFANDIQMILCTVLGKKMKYAGEVI